MKFPVFLALILCSLSGIAQTAFRHITSALNISGHITTLDHAQLNGNPNAVVFITTNWGTGATGIDYGNNVGIWYNGSRWTIFNQNTKSPMPAGVTFNVMAVPNGTPGVFRHTVTTASKTANGFLNGTRVDHPSLNGKAGVILMVTQCWTGTYNDNPIQVSNSGGCGLPGPVWWGISNGASKADGSDYDKFPMPMGASFNVMVIENGKVPGFSTASAYTHVAKQETIIPAGQNISFFDHPELNHKPDAIVFVTPFWGRGTICTDGPYVINPVSVWYDHPQDAWKYKEGFWSVYNGIGGNPMPNGAKFNVVAVSPTSSTVNNTEVFAPNAAKRDTSSLYIKLPLQKNGRAVKVDIVDNYIVYQGDMIIAPTSRYFTQSNGRYVRKNEGNAPSNDAGTPHEFQLWPNGIIPFQIAANHPRAADIRTAIQRINNLNNICLRPRSQETDFVEFTYVFDEASSWVGRVGGGQEIRIGEASRFPIGTIIHEIFHAAGMFHEQSRSDRDQFVEILWDNIAENRRHNFEREERTVGACPYDYGSIMHYHNTAFARSAGLITIRALRPLREGMVMGQRAAPSTCDISGLRNLYPHANGCNPPNTSQQCVTVFELPNYQGRSARFCAPGVQQADFNIQSIRIPSGFDVYTPNSSECFGGLLLRADVSSLGRCDKGNMIAILALPSTRPVEITLNDIFYNIHNNDCKRMYGTVGMSVALEDRGLAAFAIGEIDGGYNLIQWDKGPARDLLEHGGSVLNRLNIRRTVRIDPTLWSKCNLKLFTGLNSAHKGCDLCTDFTWDIKMPRQEVATWNLLNAINLNQVRTNQYQFDHRHTGSVVLGLRRL